MRNSLPEECSEQGICLETKTSDLIRGEIAAERLLNRGFADFCDGCTPPLV